MANLLSKPGFSVDINEHFHGKAMERIEQLEKSLAAKGVSITGKVKTKPKKMVITLSNGNQATVRWIQDA